MRSYTLILPQVLLDLIFANYWRLLPAESMRAIELPRDPSAAPVYAASLRAEPSTLRVVAHNASTWSSARASMAVECEQAAAAGDHTAPHNAELHRASARYFRELSSILRRALLPAVRTPRPVFHLYRNGVRLTRYPMRVRPCAVMRGKLTGPEQVCAIEAPRPGVRDALQKRRARHKLRTMARMARRPG